jgi:hypothetical protein
MQLVKILMSLLIMEGSHGGCACWPHTENWERCKQREELRLASPEVFVLLQVIEIHQILIFG